MKKTLCAAAFVILAGCVVPIPVPAPTTPAATNDAVTATSSRATTSFTQTLNNFRTTQGLGSVQQSARLTQAATLHAQDMVARGYFSHRSPDGPNGNTFSQRARSSGCAMRAGAENIAQGQTTAQAAFTSWSNSAGHRANMLGTSYSAYGLGRAGDTWVLLLSAGC
jgi:uncharacterized protein YkwD